MDNKLRMANSKTRFVLEQLVWIVGACLAARFLWWTGEQLSGGARDDPVFWLGRLSAVGVLLVVLIMGAVVTKRRHGRKTPSEERVPEDGAGTYS